MEAITSPNLPEASPRSARQVSPISSSSAIELSSSNSSLVTSVPAIRAGNTHISDVTSVGTQPSGGTHVNKPIVPQGPFSAVVQSHGLQLGTGLSVPRAPSTGLELGSGLQPGTVSQARGSGLQFGTVPQAPDSGLTFAFDSIQPAQQAPSSGPIFTFGTVQPIQQAPSSRLQPSIDIVPHATDQLHTAPLRHRNRSPIQQAAFVQLPRLQPTSVVPNPTMVPSPTKPAFKIVDVVCKSSLQ